MNRLIKAKPDEFASHRVSSSRSPTMNTYSHCTSVLPFVKSLSLALHYPPSLYSL